MRGPLGWSRSVRCGAEVTPRAQPAGGRVDVRSAREQRGPGRAAAARTQPLRRCGDRPRRRWHRPLPRAAAVARADAAASVERDPGATALVEVAGRSLTYGELWERAGAGRRRAASAGVACGDRVAVRLPNGIDWVLAFFGAQLLGAVAVPVNTRLTNEEVAYVLSDSGASYTFAPDGALPEGDARAGASSAPRISPRSSTRAGPRAFPRAP